MRPLAARQDALQQSRIKLVAADLAVHFEERSKAQTGNALIVAMSRDIDFFIGKE